MVIYKGIDEICNRLKIQHHTAIEWNTYFGLPIHREYTGDTFHWVSSEEELIGWLRKRGINDPIKVTRTELETYELRQLQKTGKAKKINKKLKGINQILDFCNYSMGTVYDWYTNRDAPIKKENGIMVAHADQLLEWMEDNSFITLHDSFAKREMYGR